jgi:hypothetical protein
MTLREEIFGLRVKREVELVVEKVLASPGLIPELISVTIDLNSPDSPNSPTYVVADYASWVLLKIAERKPELLKSHVLELAQRLNEPSGEPLRRHLIGAMRYLEIGEEAQEILLDIAFRFLEDIKQPIAVRAFSMGVLERLTPAYPELKDELCLILNELLSRPQSAGLRAKAKNVLRYLG